MREDPGALSGQDHHATWIMTEVRPPCSRLTLFTLSCNLPTPSAMMDRTAATAVPLLAVALLAWKYASAPARLPLPPGPKRRPLIGNLTDLPAESPWLTYHEWAKTYGTKFIPSDWDGPYVERCGASSVGEVLSVEVLGQPIVIVTSAAAAEELFERRSAIYSDRPRLVMIAELYVAPLLDLSQQSDNRDRSMGFDFTFAMIRYGEMWRQKRRVMHKYVNHKVSPSYQGMQLHESHAFVAKLLDDPQDFLAQVNQYVCLHPPTSSKSVPEWNVLQVHHTYHYERRVWHAARERRAALRCTWPRIHGLLHRGGYTREILSGHHSSQ